MPRGGLTRALAEGTLLQILGRLASAAATFGSLALAARALPLEGFGVLTFYLALWAILDVFVDAGSMTTSLRWASRRPADEAAAYASALRLRVHTAPVAFLVATLFASAEPPRVDRLELLLANAVLFGHLLTPATLPLLRQLAYRPLVAARVLGTLLTLGIASLLELRGDAEATEFLLAFGVGQLVQTWIAFRLSPRMAHASHRLERRRWLREALGLGAAALARTGYFWLDALLVRELCGAEEAGRYNGAYRLFNLALLLAVYASSTALPLLARDAAEDRSLVLRLGGGIAAAGIAIATLLALAAPWLLTTAFGPDYAAAAPSLQALCPGIAAVHLSSLALTRLTAQGRARAVATLSFVALGTNAVLDLLWIPAHAGLGAAWATSCTEGLVAALALLAVLRARPSAEGAA